MHGRAGAADGTGPTEADGGRIMRKGGSDPFPRTSFDMSPRRDTRQWSPVLQLHLLAFGATDANGASDANSVLVPFLLPNGASDAKI